MLEGVGFCLSQCNIAQQHTALLDPTKLWIMGLCKVCFWAFKQKKIELTPLSQGRNFHEEARLLVFSSQSWYRLDLGMKK